MYKKVKHILPAEKVDMGGFPVKQALPTNSIEQVDPYLLLHHGQIKPIYDRPANIQGVGPHPHRGFSPVTFVIEGEVNHRDSRGNNQVAKAGEVQWMHAGAGIVHSERPSQELIDAKGIQEIIQLWINTPAANKMKEPEYKHVAAEAIPRIAGNDPTSDIKLITGTYSDVTGAFKGQSELLILWVTMEAGAEEMVQIPDNFSAMIYSIKGDIVIGGHGIADPESLAVFGDEGDEVHVRATTDTQFLVLSGKPLNEPLAQYGPFVMNTQTEIMEAMRDYQMGKMGVLIED